MRHRIWQIFRRRKRVEPRTGGEIRHPVRSDFHAVVTKAAVNVIFKPTNSIYVFVVDNNGPVSLAGVQHAGSDTGDYPSLEVQDIARQIASKHAVVHFGQLQLEAADVRAKPGIYTSRIKAGHSPQ